MIVWLVLVDWTTDKESSSLGWMGLLLILTVYFVAGLSAWLTTVRGWVMANYGW